MSLLNGIHAKQTIKVNVKIKSELKGNQQHQFLLALIHTLKIKIVLTN